MLESLGCQEQSGALAWAAGRSYGKARQGTKVGEQAKISFHNYHPEPASEHPSLPDITQLTQYANGGLSEDAAASTLPLWPRHGRISLRAAHSLLAWWPTLQHHSGQD